MATLGDLMPDWRLFSAGDNPRVPGQGPEDNAALPPGEQWRRRPTIATATHILRWYEQLKGRGYDNLTPYHLFIARSWTVEPIVPLLRCAALFAGLDLEVTLGAFGQYGQVILDPASPLYQANPDAVALVTQTADVAPMLWGSFADLTAREVADEIERAGEDFRDLVGNLRVNTDAHLLVHTLEQPCWPAGGILDHNGADAMSQRDAIRAVNGYLERIARDHHGVYLVDYDGLVAQHGRLGWHDQARWVSAGLPIASCHHLALAEHWLQYLVPLAGRTCKCLVLDLDNTLWGGVVGEDGYDGINLDPRSPVGAGHLALQRAALDLSRRGVLLAIVSRNNEPDAMRVLRQHPEMLLRPEHFAAIRINWRDKPENIVGIAAELNIGLDAIALFDDNPAERAMVRSGLPDVVVIEPPLDPKAYADALRRAPWFERLRLTDEDRHRGQYYAAERERTALRGVTTELPSYFRALGMVVEIGRLTQGCSPALVQRVAQLTQRTNQFNLTTHRYTEQEITELLKAPDSFHVYWCRLRDRFGDHGIVGAMIVALSRGSWDINTMLLSCRAMNRGVEAALLATVAEHARAAGAPSLVGWFRPTAKNAPAEGFYRSLGFRQGENGDDPAWTCWTFDLANPLDCCPDWLDRRVVTGPEGVAA